MVSFLTDTVVCGFSLYHILAYFLIYSCIGWCLEVIYAAATTGQLVNRGFLNGPVCPIYGFGMIIVLFALTPLQHSILLLYIGGVILPSALELVGGWALYKLYHTRWWDYSDFPFNIGGYICLEFCLLWGVGTLVVMRIVHPVVADLVNLIPPLVGVILMCFLYAVYAVDVVATAIAASALADTLDTMEQLGDSIHAVSDAMTQLLGTTTLNADQKLDEGRLQFKLAAAEAREEEVWKMHEEAKQRAETAESRYKAALADVNSLAEANQQKNKELEAARKDLRAAKDCYSVAKKNEAFQCERIKTLQEENAALKKQPIAAVVDEEEMDKRAHQQAYAIAADMTGELRQKLERMQENDAAWVFQSKDRMESEWERMVPMLERMEPDIKKAALDGVLKMLGRIQGQVFALYPEEEEAGHEVPGTH